jgi:hypothetical protein
MSTRRKRTIDVLENSVIINRVYIYIYIYIYKANNVLYHHKTKSIDVYIDEFHSSYLMEKLHCHAEFNY